MLRKGMFLGDRYEIIELIGSGGMSDVYKAKCHKLNRFVAIKVLKKEFSEDRGFVQKFKTEAQSVACLQHPNIVGVYDVGEENGIYYIVMELIEGITLKKYIRRKGHLSVKETTNIAIQVAMGLECAHNNHIIHRDIKPQNIIISREGKVKVADFGIARAASANTVNSNAMGSVHYISPEQARGGYVDEKSDIYSLGITMFEMLTGHLPFEGDTTVTIALQHIQKPLPDMHAYVADIPVSTMKIVDKCTQKKPDHRYLKISSLITDLKKSLETPDEDFVVIPTDDFADGKTAMFNPDEVKTNLVLQDPITINDEDEEDTGDLEILDDEYQERPDEEELEDLDTVNPKLKRALHIGVIAIGIIFLVVIVMLAIQFFTKSDTSGNKNNTVNSSTLADGYVNMPNLVGMTEDEAAAALSACHLGKKVEYKDNEEYDKGKVFEQSVEKDTVIAENTTVTIYVSNGPVTFALDDCVGKTLDDAKTLLTKQKLTTEVKYEYSDKYDTNVVMEMSPKAGTMVKAKDVITLTVSRGKQYDDKSEVPNLKGLTLEQAKAAILKAKLTVGNVTEQTSDTVDKDMVISQGMPEGTKVPADTPIDIVVSTGSAKVLVPDLGFGTLTRSDAKAKLENAHLKLGKVTEQDSSIEKGKVINQSISANTEVDKGTKVDIVISKGEDTSKRVYSGSFMISKSDFTDASGAELKKGKVQITVDGKAVPLTGGYADLSTWPSDTFTYTIERESGGVAKVKASCSGMSGELTFPVDLK